MLVPPGFLCFWGAVPGCRFSGLPLRESQPSTGLPVGFRERTGCGVMGLDSGGPSYPFSLLPPSQPPPAFPAVSIPIWSQVNLWHNPTWKCMEMLPITMKPRERLSRWRPPWSAVCRLPAFQKPQGARSQPFGPDWRSGAVCIKLFISLTWP